MHHDPANPLARLSFSRFAPTNAELPADQGIELCWAGRSNVGKSSLINALCGQRGLARVSRTPGRTQGFVVFQLDDRTRFIDLPGYGYAEVPQALRERWGTELSRYFGSRQSLRAIIQVVDARHGCKPQDLELLKLTYAIARPVIVLANKLDKLATRAGRLALATIARQAPGAEVLGVSAQSGQGLDAARARIVALLTASE